MSVPSGRRSPEALAVSAHGWVPARLDHDPTSAEAARMAAAALLDAALATAHSHAGRATA